ncbi:MAG: hypothetical protein M1816_002223 [Peltula sp. TS41687]|nr:MAG: hypothetical protein M1816_002223 [Peltula sp. TS41687]
MVSSFALYIVAFLGYMITISQAKYTLVENYTPSNFFEKFNFFNLPDPTNGFVKYVDKYTAKSSGLISSNKTSVYIGVDHKTISPNGRASVRLESQKKYTHGLFIVDITHMPGGICGTWPAFWTTGLNWPNNGEIDIVENVNLGSTNEMTLHTAAGCTMDGGTRLGSTISKICYGNMGCGVWDHNTQSYGTIFNRGGGGVYAMEWTSQRIAVWFWPRDRVPWDVQSPQPDPSRWSDPVAQFRGNGCAIDSYFRDHQIIFDTTFCGDWAGNVWGTSGCLAKAPTCNEYIANNPSAFKEAYWEVKSLRVFQNTYQPYPSPPRAPFNLTMIWNGTRIRNGTKIRNGFSD